MCQLPFDALDLHHLLKRIDDLHMELYILYSNVIDLYENILL